MTLDQDHHRAVVLMVHRLVYCRGVTVGEALTTVDQRRRGEPGPHTDLVTAEADEFARESSASLRALLGAFEPLAAATAAAMAELSKALQPVAQQLAQHAAASRTRTRRRGRPAWSTPYGPPPRRRSAR